jgi:hypothetical protein
MVVREQAMTNRLASLTPLVIIALALLAGAMLFVYFTMVPPVPMLNTTPGPNNALAYGDSRYYAYNDIFNEASYKQLTTGRPSALGYSLYISCVEYKSQLACDQFDLLQQNSQEVLERR